MKQKTLIILFTMLFSINYIEAYDMFRNEQDDVKAILANEYQKEAIEQALKILSYVKIAWVDEYLDTKMKCSNKFLKKELPLDKGSFIPDVDITKENCNLQIFFKNDPRIPDLTKINFYIMLTFTPGQIISECFLYPKNRDTSSYMKIYACQ